MALGGRVVLRKGDKTRALPLEDFFIAYGKQDREPGEFVLAVEAPRLAAHQRYRAFKVSKRFDEDISAVMLRGRVDLDGRRIRGARVACGGMAATPKRAEQAEQALAGANLDDPTSWGAAREAMTRTSPRSPTCAPPPPIARRSPPTSWKRRSWKFPARARRPGLECSMPPNDDFAASARRRPRSFTSRCRTIPRACMSRARRLISTTSASPRARCISRSAWPTRPAAN